MNFSFLRAIAAPFISHSSSCATIIMASISKRRGVSELISPIATVITAVRLDRSTDGGMLTSSGRSDSYASRMEIQYIIDGLNTRKIVTGARGSDRGAAAEIGVVPRERIPRIVSESTNKTRADSFSINTSKPDGKKLAGKDTSNRGLSWGSSSPNSSDNIRSTMEVFILSNIILFSASVSPGTVSKVIGGADGDEKGSSGWFEGWHKGSGSGSNSVQGKG